MGKGRKNMYLSGGMVHIVHSPVYKKESINLLDHFIHHCNFLYSINYLQKTQNVIKCNSSTESASMKKNTGTIVEHFI